MSSIRKEYGECMKCHKKAPFYLHNSINVGIDPQDKKKVLDMSIFQYCCPYCGNRHIECYPVLYHDPENEIMIQVLWREEDFGQPVGKEEEEMIRLMGHDHYIRREVFGYWELIEKIRVFDAGLDDFAIAMLKTVYKTEQPEIKLIFNEKKGKRLKFLQFKNGEMQPEPDSVYFNEDAYEAAVRMAQKLEKPHEFYEDLRVDESYFYDDLMNALRQEEEE